MPVWPDSIGLRLSRTLALANGDPANVSRLDMDVHCGTHVEAPIHFIHGGDPLEAFPIELFVGPAWVAHVPGVPAISASDLEGLGMPQGIERLLLRTANSDLWQSANAGFDSSYVALLPSAATWIVERGIRLVGIDYLSIQRYGDDPETHRILMRAGVAILEGLNLDGVAIGSYRLVCPPIRLHGAEAAPARAFLETDA
jgi:arylformamidase